MTVKELISYLKVYRQDAKIMFASDEELNTIRTNGEIAILDGENNELVIYGLSGSEREE
jgi:hypothetical protein